MGKKRGKSPILKLVSSLFSGSFLRDDFSFSKRRAQISTFLIISLVLVLFVAVIFFVINSQLSLREKASQSVISELSLFPPEKYVTHCVQKEIVDIAQIVLSQGGVYDLSKNQNESGRSLDYYSFRAQPYLFWSRLSGNQFISNEFVSKQMNEQLPDALLSCINLSLYASQGYTVTSGRLLTNTTVESDGVSVVVYYPLAIKKGGTIIERSVYAVTVDLPIGSVLSMAREIVNGHLQGRPLDTQVLMHQNANDWLSKPLVVIDKNTIFPHTLYSLELNYKEISIPLRFSLEGSDVFSSSASSLTSSNIFSTNSAMTEKSSCLSVSGACFDLVSYNLCVNSGGEFIQDQTCVEHSGVISNSVTDAFQPCSFSDETSVPSGSSWCAAGADGQPFIGVGSRHSRLLCVNGKVLQEPCQDYRLEVCAQTQNDDGLLIAQCQPNLATSCSQCSDKSCCDELSRAGSCIFNAQQVCVPKVSLGIPFWRSGLNICQDQFNIGLESANGKISSPNAQAMLCAQYADCGATVSVIGETTQSSFNTDYYSKLVSFWQQQNIKYVDLNNLQDVLSRSTLATGSQNSRGSAGVGVSVGTSSESASGTSQQPQSVSAMLSNALADIEQLAGYDTNDYLNPNISMNLNTQTLSCQPYLSPKTPSCSFCSLYDKACSEYVCRSLGSSCRAIQNTSSDSGVTCVDSSFIENQPIHITHVTDPQGNSFTPTILAGLSGFKVNQPLSAHELLIVNLTTDRPARCKPTYLPSLSFSDVGSLDLSSGVYTKQHQLKIKFVNDLPVFDRVLVNFAVPDYAQLVDALADFKLRLDQLRLRYGFIQKYNPTFYPYLNTIVNQYVSPRTRPTLLALMDGISQKQFAIFFVCQDEYGNELTSNSQVDSQQDSNTQRTSPPRVSTVAENSFIEFKLQPSCAPQPPTILASVPDADPYVQRSVTLYLDKVGSCKYDTQQVTFDAMRYNMVCASSEYELSSKFDGSYACTADMTVLSSEASQFYVSCSDKVTNLLPVKSISLFANVTVPARVYANLSNESLSELNISSKASVWTGLGYRCAIRQNSTSSESELTTSQYSLTCSLDSCLITYKNLTSSVSGGSSIISENESLYCVARVPASSCSVDQTHISAPLAVPITKLPAFEYIDAGVVGREFVVNVKSRGSPITCTLTDESGKSYSLTAKTAQSFVMSTSLLKDKTLVTITCGDGYGFDKNLIGSIKK